MKQYINNNSYEMVIPTLETDDETTKGLNKTGVLMLKNRTDVIEYHLYDKSKPESVDINQTLDLHLYSTTKKKTYIHISSGNELLCEGTGRLVKVVDDSVDIYLLIGDEYIDIEKLLFENTEKTITIKINTVHNAEVIVDKDGGNQVDGFEEN